MSITDNTGNVSTTWTEQTTVAFNSGTLAVMGACVTEVESKLRRGTLTNLTTPTVTEVERWIIRAKQELMEIKNYTFRRRYAYTSTVSGTYRYALPPDYDGGRLAVRDTSNKRLIPVWVEHWFNLRYPSPADEATNMPLAATVKNMELWLMPPPDSAYTIELEYDRSGADNTATDMSYLPEVERFRCCDFAVYQAFKSLHMWAEATTYKQDWMEGLTKARRADAKRRWKTMRFQAMSIFQEHATAGHQLDPEA